MGIKFLHFVVDSAHQRAFYAYCEIELRQRSGCFAVLDNIDAAHKCPAAINHRQLSMEPPQTLAWKAQRRYLWTINER